MADSTRAARGRLIMDHSRIAMFLPSLDGGGAERVFVELANYIAGQGVPVDLVLASATGPYLGEVRAPVRVIDCGATGVSRALPGLARHLRRERCAAVLSALEHANVVALAARIVALSAARSVVSVRGVPTMLAHEAGDRAASWVLRASRFAYRFAHAIIANSHGVADDMSAHLGIARRRIDVIYNPLNIDYIEQQSQAPLTHPFIAPGAPPLFLSAGRISPLKDFPTLVRGFAELRASRPCRLVILGEGPDRAALEQLVKQLGLEADVALPGFDPNPFAWMRRASAFISSSLSEGCPNALMQALACGTPVISTRAIGGSVEVLENGRWGRLVPVSDPKALGAAMAATLDENTHPDVRQRARDFSMPRVAREYLAVLLPQEFARGAA